LARTFIIRNATAKDFIISQALELGKKATGEAHPPKKQIAIMKESHNILLYSARKNRANVIEEYSTLKPATSSASASGRSNGALLVSANNDMKKTTQVGNRGRQNQVLSSCWATISIRLKEFAQIAIGSKISPIDTS